MQRATRLAAPLARLGRGYRAYQERHPRLLLAVQLLYLCLFTGLLLATHTWPAPDVVMVGLLGFAILTARGLGFLRDWTPFLALLLLYVALPGIAPGLINRAHVDAPIVVDRWLGGGQLLTTRLQTALWDPAHLHWYDYLSAMLYMLHFIAPLGLAFALWLRSRSLFQRFVRAYVLLIGAGLVTYLLYPMAPPWWASELGRIPTVQPVLGLVHWGSVGDPVTLLSRYFQTDPVAAMPSMHAAFPVLVWLVIWRLSPRWGWATVVYPLAMGFAVIYTGQHYLVDVLAGWAYAGAVFVDIWRPRRARETAPVRSGAARPLSAFVYPRPATAACDRRATQIARNP